MLRAFSSRPMAAIRCWASCTGCASPVTISIGSAGMGGRGIALKSGIENGRRGADAGVWPNANAETISKKAAVFRKVVTSARPFSWQSIARKRNRSALQHLIQKSGENSVRLVTGDFGPDAAAGDEDKCRSLSDVIATNHLHIGRQARIDSGAGCQPSAEFDHFSRRNNGGDKPIEISIGGPVFLCGEQLPEHRRIVSEFTCRIGIARGAQGEAVHRQRKIAMDDAELAGAHVV